MTLLPRLCEVLGGWKHCFKDHRKMQQLEGLSAQGAKLLNELRERCNRITAWKNKILWSVVDASFCNRAVFSLLDPRIVLIGRVRKDIRLYSPAKAEASVNAGRGRKASYGSPLPTSEQLRQDPDAPWKTCNIFAAGKKHSLNYKTLAPVFWRSCTATRSMRLIVIRPLRYRAHIMEPLRVGIDVPEPKLIHRMENFKSFRVQDIISDSSSSYKVGKIEVRNAQKVIPTSTVVCRLFIRGYT